MVNERDAVGSIDDETRHELSASPTTRRTRPRSRVVIAGLMLMAVGLVVVASLLGGGHQGGDPGDVVVQTLSKIRQAVPPAASVESDRVNPAVWSAACGDGSRPGWEQPSVDVRFTDGASSQSVVTTITAVLARLGWQRHDVATGPGQGGLAHWSLAIPGQKSADAFAYPVPAGSTSWFLTADWRPPGPRPAGCG